MSGALSVNGKSVASGSLTFPRFGTWTADLATAGAAEITGDATVTFGDLVAKGTVIQSGTYAGNTSARLVGGKAGWRKVLPAKGYSHAAGVKLSDVLGDAARATGESIAVASDRTLGAHWTRDEAKAEALLTLLLDGAWWMDLNGVTQTGDRDSGPIVTPFTASRLDGAREAFEIATELYTPWQPGRTFQSSTMPAPKTISSVTLTASNDGKVSITVLAQTASVIDRLHDDMRALIRRELASLAFAGVWEYEVTKASENMIDAKPVISSMPQITNLKLFPSLLGEDVTPVAGSICHVVFANNDPGKPLCTSIDGVPLMFKLAGGTPLQGIARVGDTVQAGPYAGVILSGSTKGFCG